MHYPESFVARASDQSRHDQSRNEPDKFRQDDGPVEASRARSSDRCRTKMISFRVSEREFEMLRERSESEGARNISEYARQALCEGPKPSESDIRRLSSEIERLGAGVARVTRLIEQTAGVNPSKTDHEPE